METKVDQELYHPGRYGALLSVCAIAWLITFSTSSYAGGCSCGGVYNIVRSARIEINNHTTDIGNYIVDNILKGVAQLSAYSKRETEAAKRIAEGRDQNAVLLERQKIRAAAEGGRYDPAASAFRV